MKTKILFFPLLFITIFTISGQQFTSKINKFDIDNSLSGVVVTSILQDKQGFIWVGSLDGLTKYNGYEFTKFRNISGDSTSLSYNQIMNLSEDRQGNIWVATFGGGISKYNPKTNTFKKYMQKQSDSTKISHNHIESIFVDSKNQIWAGHWEGLDLYNPEKDRFERVLGPESDTNTYRYLVFDIESDTENSLWLATNGSGLLKFNTESLQIEKSYSLNPNYPDKRPGSKYLKVNKVVKDDQGTFWFSGMYGAAHFNPNTDEVPTNITNIVNDQKDYYHFISKTEGGEIIVQSSLDKKFKLLDPKTGKILHVFNRLNLSEDLNISSVIEDKAGSFWFGGKGLFYAGAESKPFRYHESISDNKIEPDVYSELFEDSNGFLWFASKNEGLVRLNRDNCQRETYPQITAKLKPDENGITVRNIIEDKSGNIWIFSFAQVIRLNTNTNDFKIFDDLVKTTSGYPMDGYFEYGIESKDGTLWICTKRGYLFAFDPILGKIKQQYLFHEIERDDAIPAPGFYMNIVYEDLQGNLLIGYEDAGLFKLDRSKNIFQKINYHSTDETDIAAKQITSIYQNNKEVLWIGTASGLFKFNTQNNTSVQYGIKEGLPNAMINDIIDDGLGNLWLTTNRGISKFNPLTETFKNYDSDDGLNQNFFNRVSSFKSEKDGLIFLSSLEGINVFDPRDIKDNNYIPEIVITNFKKHNAQGDFISMPGINYLEALSLPYNERDFTIEIASLDYTNPGKNQYAYWLEGYNTNWVEIGSRREITFTNLSSGSYTLRIKGSNNDGVWNEKGRTLSIIILPPWWLTWWAYTIYMFVVLALFYGVYRYRVNQLETVRLKELDQAKKTMYTNITHEFRTPLTVIAGINKELRDQSNGNFKKQFDLVERNSKNMLDLVNQLLELRKLEIGKIRIEYIQDNIISYLKYIAGSFETYAQTKDITLHFVCITNQLLMDYDPDKLFMILSNLLSNAIKYSEQGNDVFMQVDELDGKLQIRIVDSGRGISEQDLPHIFDRFYKVKNSGQDNFDGMGIGLAVTKELVELLNGEITVNSTAHRGSIFTITLPILNNASKPKTITPPEPKVCKTPNEFSLSTKELEKNTLRIASKKELRLLIIEDNADIIHYLTSCLQEHWVLDVAQDGKLGIEKAIENVPDIILCDLMMPNVDGYQVLKVLKNDTRTSHIPIVILTAKADDDSRIEAYKRGADSFLLKPFNRDELLIILENLVEQRALLQQRYKLQNAFPNSENFDINKEDHFIQKLEELVLNEDSKTPYSVSRLCTDLGMSRTQLHHKIKALTGKSTSIFVRSLRLRKAKYLLEQTNKGISEIAYDVGFNNPSYFTRSFTEEYGIPPSAIKDRKVV
ncbi:two-component regulator propeller domain-containing protein [Ascidiimonas sp. W6]|uniref:hybrid sensor histidine kinase/response regulator transcription factor n=1 Tax=Ascidiimonas meishanensis TaxID=3128903 RepID=UPI0030ECE3E8